LFRRLDLESADEQDYWIGSSRYTVARYLRAGAPPDRLFLSYYGWPTSRFPTERTHILRRRFGISDDQLAVGNMNWMYPPKYYLGQFVGLKCHEDVIDALAIVTRRRADVVGLLVGGGWGRRAGRYEERLRARARKVAGDRIKMTGYVPIAMAFQAWPDFDCVVHVPLSENCGGVLEPLLAGVPTIGGDVGGIPELVVDGTTGTLVRTRRPAELAEAILEVLGNPERSRSLAAEGQKRARELMDPGRTAEELVAIYRHLLNASNPRPQPYEYSPLVSANAK